MPDAVLVQARSLQRLTTMVVAIAALSCGGDQTSDCDPVACAASAGPCQVGTCDHDLGECYVQVDDGASCDDGDPCTTMDTCISDICRGTAKDCSGMDDMCNTGVCNPADGACMGESKVDCSDAAGVCMDGVCDPATGGCKQAATADGARCYEQLFCSSDDACSAGVCLSTSGACQERWIAVIVGATIRSTDHAGQPWDGGVPGLTDQRPDPKFCLQFSNGALCTDEALDTLNPAWGAQLPPFEVAELAAGLDFTLVDIDDDLLGGADDTICEGRLQFTRAQLDAGTANFDCTIATQGNRI